MIIKGSITKAKPSEWRFPVALLFVILGFIAIRSFANNLQSKQSDNRPTFYCGAETTSGKNFIANGHVFGGGNTQSTQYTRTGKYACRLDSNQLKGFSYTIEQPKPGALYKAEVYRYTKKAGKSFLTIQAENKADFFQQTDKDVETEGTWWVRMEQVFRIPTKKKIEAITVYVHMEKSGGIILFDDFKITELDSMTFAFNNFEALDYHVNIDPPGEAKLNAIKQRSFSQGILIKTDDDFVKADVTTTDGLKRGKVRLKGDWLDHIFKGKSSFRVQLKSTDNWQGMQVFSLQSPETRGMLNEWVYHELLGMADVLSPRYDFINFHYNEGKPMVYAYEEHFTKNLVENQLRREGPIIKFTEDRFWEGMSRSIKNSRTMAGADNKESAFWKAQIKPFKENKTLANPNLKSAFEIAQNLLQQYQYGTKKASEVFDIHRIAKYMAITDFLQATHAITWHNQRFYFNPVTNLLEPIGFDGYGSTDAKDPNAMLHAQWVYQGKGVNTEPVDRLFYDPEFVTLYLKYLNQYSNQDFIKKLTAQLEEPLTAREAFLKTAYPKYRFDRTRLMTRSNKIQARIFPFENSIQAFREPKGKDSITVRLINTHILPLQIIETGSAQISNRIDTTQIGWVFPAREGVIPEYTVMTLPASAKSISYRMPGHDVVYTSPIAAWKAPEVQPPRQELLTSQHTPSPPYDTYKEMKDVIHFVQDEYHIKHPIVIPKNKKVTFFAGTRIKFSEGGFLLSFSPVYIKGTEEKPVIFESLDKQSGALAVMQAPTPSTVSHAIFRNQNTISYKGWNLTGAVTFYESDVTIDAARFIDNLCEDGLNIVRSEFELSNSLFKGIYSDAFDADFCNGVVTKCGFEDIGNDALDFSTSKINITNCKMNTVGDKAISAGEQATINATHIDVEQSNIGFASKDNSVLSLDHVSVTSTSKGFTAYQKKPEFGPATIHLKNYTMTDVKFPFMIEDRSVLNK